MPNIVPTDESMAMLADSHSSGTLSDKEFCECLEKLRESFPDRSEEELKVMCYDLLEKRRG